MVVDVEPCRDDESVSLTVFSRLKSVREVDAEADVDATGVSSPELGFSVDFALDVLIVSARLVFVFLTALKISIGKSATPMPRLAMVPSRADAPPEMGSQGPSSVSYSRGRYLCWSAFESNQILELLTTSGHRNPAIPHWKEHVRPMH